MPEYINKEYYRQLAPNDRTFLNLTAQSVKAVMDRLTAENIKFSATVGYKNTVTVSKADSERAMDIVKSFADKNRSSERIIGNTQYKDLPPSERKYINTDPETALQAANILAGDSAIKFSGRINANSATITVSDYPNKRPLNVSRSSHNTRTTITARRVRELRWQRDSAGRGGCGGCKAEGPEWGPRGGWQETTV